MRSTSIAHPTKISRRWIWGAGLVGLVAAVLVIGLAFVAALGADLVRFSRGTAAVFFAAGLVCPTAGSRSIAGRSIAVAAGGCAPILGLAAAGVAFESAAWLGSYVVVAVVFTVAGLVARQRLVNRARLQALVVAAAAWAALLLAGRAVVTRFVVAAQLDRMTRPIAPFTLIGSSGGELRSLDLHGRVVVLAFWATWCTPCRAELPELAALADHYRSDPRVAVWWPNTGRDGDTLDDARAFAAQHHVDPRLTFAFDRDHIADRLGVLGLPAIALLDGEGRLRARHTGFDTSEGLADAIAHEVDRLLAER